MLFGLKYFWLFLFAVALLVFSFNTGNGKKPFRRTGRLRLRRIFYSAWFLFGVLTLCFIKPEELKVLGKNPFFAEEVWLLFVMMLCAFVLDILILNPMGVKGFNVAGISFVSEEDFYKIDDIILEQKQWVDRMNSVAAAEHYMLMRVIVIADEVNEDISEGKHVDFIALYNQVLAEFCQQVGTDLQAMFVVGEVPALIRPRGKALEELESCIDANKPYLYKFGEKHFAVIPVGSVLFEGCKSLIILTTCDSQGFALIDQLSVQNIIIKLEENIITSEPAEEENNLTTEPTDVV